MNADAFVIGAGVAGLAAAVRLAQHDRRVVVFEARGTSGGRATSFDDRQGGPPLDNGQHALMGCYHETLGSRDLVRVQPSLSVSVVDTSGARSTLSCPSWPSPFQMLAGVARWEAVPLAERVQLLRMAPALWRARQVVATGRGDLPASDDETVRQWLTRHGQGARLTALLWEPLAVAALNQGIDAASARPFVRVLGQVFGPGRDDASIALVTRPLIDVVGRPAERFLSARGSRVVCHALARVELDGSQAVRIVLRDAAPVELHGRPVIVAVPWHALPQVMAGDTTRVGPVLAAAAATRPVSIVSVNLWFDRQVLDVPMLGIEGRSFQWAFAREGYVSLVMSGADAIVNAATRSRRLPSPTSGMPFLRRVRRHRRGRWPSASRVRRSRCAPDSLRVRPPPPPSPTCCSRATGSRPACPQPSKAQPSPAAGPPITSCRRAEPLRHVPARRAVPARASCADHPVSISLLRAPTGLARRCATRFRRSRRRRSASRARRGNARHRSGRGAAPVRT